MRDYELWDPLDEFCLIAEVDDPRVAVVRLGIVEESPRELLARVLVPWRRMGSESYSCVVELSGEDEVLARLFLKALVPFPGGVEEAVDAHQQRYRHLSDSGVPMPRYYSARRGVIVMDHIEHPFWKYLGDIAGSDRQDLLGRARQLAHQVVQAGYRPVAGALDLRTDGEHVLLVDLGSDLGQPDRRQYPVALREVIAWLDGQETNLEAR